MTIRRCFRRRHPSHHLDGGFAMLEMLVSLALIAMLLTLLPAAVRFGREAWQAEAQLERAAALGAARDLIFRLLAAAVPKTVTTDASATVVRFDGLSDAVAFVAPPVAGLDTGGLQLVRIAAPVRASGRRDLVIAVTPSTSGDGRREGRAGEPAETLVAEHVGELRVRYFGAQGAGAESGWSETWLGRSSLPQLVEVSFAVAGVDRGATTIVVAPRLAARAAR